MYVIQCGKITLYYIALTEKYGFSFSMKGEVHVIKLNKFYYINLIN